MRSCWPPYTAKVPKKMGIRASELDHWAMEEDGLAGWIGFSLRSRGWPSACAWPTWEKHGNRVHYGREHRQYDGLETSLIGKNGPAIENRPSNYRPSLFYRLCAWSSWKSLHVCLFWQDNAPRTQQKWFSNGIRAQQHIWIVYLAFNTPQITNLVVSQTPLFRGRILRDLEDLPTSWCQRSSGNITQWVRAVLAAKIKRVDNDFADSYGQVYCFIFAVKTGPKSAFCMHQGFSSATLREYFRFTNPASIERNKCFTGTKELYLFLKVLLS